ncbi:unnamed protein product [Diatraea saccharalis]|uniref:B30.2/SPRY domain-containing protein n=1 Tax=Diatraea saccharalis TaxID=40085 RepID=A0A9N9R0C7_9NEOP|nr:unnamed protein product [Diatraea saccharalis]
MFISPMGPPKTRANNDNDRRAKPFCHCWNQRAPMSWRQLNSCSCGEDKDCYEWNWEQAETSGPSWVVISDDQKQVTFHPFYSSGTAAVRGNMPLLHNYHYYWEVKMLTETYGTDIMVGVGTDKVNMADVQFKFTSLLGADGESYGLSYTGALRHDATVMRDAAGFCRGTIIGVRLDMWQGTLEFYINRKPQGVSFYNLRRHKALYPMVCSTAAQSSMRLTYAASWRASLLVDAARALAAAGARAALPPGLWYKLRAQFWLTLPNDGCALEDEDDSMQVEPLRLAPNVLSEILPSQYLNGFYVDNVDREYRVMVWE